jgi:hypothetical protein
MKKQTNPNKPAKSEYTFFRQIVQNIPRGMMERIAKEHKADIRKFSCTSHVVAIIYGHLTKARSLNEICDGLRLHASELSKIKNATPPKRNTFSNANRTRDPAIAEKIFWEVLDHIKQTYPDFAYDKKHTGFLARIKRSMFAIDSTTLQLALNCFDWAKHRRKKAAAKTHMCLNIGSGIPSFAVVDKASNHDSTRAEEICVKLKEGDILLADKAYVKFDFLHGLSNRGIYFVLREKKNMCFEVIESRTHTDSSVITDETIKLTTANTSKKYPDYLRRVKAIVEVDGKKIEMTFLTNNFQWSPRTIAELYRRRWAIEIFFKEIKQTLQLADFIGYNDKAVKWQVWIGLLTHILLRLLKHLSKWKLSFSRLYGVVKSAIWMRIDLFKTLSIYGTANPPRRPVPFTKQLYFKGFDPNTSNPMGQP